MTYKEFEYKIGELYYEAFKSKTSNYVLVVTDGENNEYIITHDGVDVSGDNVYQDSFPELKRIYDVANGDIQDIKLKILDM